MSRGVLEVRDVHRRFATVDVLRGVDFVVHPDELIALVGENGAGKTTLVRCIAGSLVPDRGQVLVNGTPVDRTGGAPMAGVEVVWQDLALCDNLDVIDNLFLGREDGALLGRREDEQVLARGLFDRLGVAMPDPDRPVASFSGGQRQTIALARTLVRPPSLLVLDEPTGALDSSGVHAVRSLLKGMRAQRTAILLISHDLDLVCEVADRVLVLRDGVITHDVRRPDLTPDLLRGCMSGLEADVLARQQTCCPWSSRPWGWRWSSHGWRCTCTGPGRARGRNRATVRRPCGSARRWACPRRSAGTSTGSSSGPASRRARPRSPSASSADARWSSLTCVSTTAATPRRW